MPTGNIMEFMTHLMSRNSRLERENKILNEYFDESRKYFKIRISVALLVGIVAGFFIGYICG